MSFGETSFAQFISSTGGRLLRIVVGLALIGWGYVLRHETTGIVLIVVGCIPLSAGAFDLCYISGLIGGPWAGAAIRTLRKRPG